MKKARVSLLYYASEDRYLRNKNQFINAQTKQDWGWNFDNFQQEFRDHRLCRISLEDGFSFNKCFVSL